MDKIEVPKRKNTKAYEKRAEKTVKLAEAIYKSYEKDRPNPLNLDDKDICQEAKEMWAYIYSLRKPRKGCELLHTGWTFENMGELQTMYEAYCLWIIKNKFIKDNDVLLPTLTEFARWCGLIPSVVFAYIKRNGTPSNRKDMEQIMGDVLAKGVNNKAYKDVFTIFCLKNWCNWSERQEIKQETGQRYSEEEIAEKLKNLGYEKKPLSLAK